MPDRVDDYFVTALFGSFSFVGLCSALIAVYGMAVYSVEQREREFGVRIALGAQTRDIIRLGARARGRDALLGLAIGLIVAIGPRLPVPLPVRLRRRRTVVHGWGSRGIVSPSHRAGGDTAALRAARVYPADTLRSE